MWFSRLLPIALVGFTGTHLGPHPQPARQSDKSLRALIVGGGPDLKHNQVAIESNVRYVDRLLPANSSRRILFADGSKDSKSVLYTDGEDKDTYRTTQIAHLDGPSLPGNIQAEFSGLAKDLETTPTRPVLVYFTGHGSPDDGFVNNRYDLWDGNELTVKDLSTRIQSLPKSGPIALVMVECFSGAFANVIFDKGNPDGPLTDQPVCGFFASVSQRMAAGCTPNVNEEDYRDFTGYFFAALTGVDRLGRKVTGADYNHDGHVGMNEAFAYSLIHDDSIDTPVCTSDAFVRRFVTTPDQKVFENHYRDAQKWATPAQRAALDALSADLHLDGDDRLAKAFLAFRSIQMESEADYDVHLIRFVRLAKSIVLAHELMTKGDETVKRRYEDLIRAEAANPLRS